jgi:Protein of unknown function (DUF1612)/HTH DNA binding domain
MSDNLRMEHADFDSEFSPQEAVFVALAQAEDRISRLDERVRGSGFREGWSGRADVRAVLGAMSADGALVHPEDLILHDLGADVRPPEASVVRARGLLQARRKARLGGPELLSWGGLAWLGGAARHAPPPGARPTTRVEGMRAKAHGYLALVAFFDALAKGESESSRAGVEDCLAVLDVPGVPVLLLAAALVEAWRVVDPLPRQRSVGSLAASVWLKAAGRFTVGLFPLDVVFRRRSMPARLAWSPLHERLHYWLSQFALAADLELEELTRLGHQKALIERKVSAARRSSRAPDFARLAVDTPVLTTESIARALSITPQASLQLVRRMNGVLHEITGRSRYRVWQL